MCGVILSFWLFLFKQGVANERRISVADGEMRHGRKSKSKRIDGYKRHVAKDMDSHAVIACVATPANRPECEAVPVLKSDIEKQGIRVGETHIDRGCIASAAISELETTGSLILCKPWKNSDGELYSKEDFNINLKTQKGRQQFRERVSVEHPLAHIGQRQGKKVRYLGTRKNTFELRRAAAIQNLEIAQRNAA